MIFKHDIFTFEVFREHNELKIHMIEYTTEEGQIISLVNPCDMTYVLCDSIINEVQDEFNEQENE
tara:strand:+ start:193 stop:387 length:195 start_codon:yes stop_codon:yes gene_type:complete